MKSVARKSLAGLMLLAITVLAAAQIGPPSKSRLPRRYSRNLGSQRSLPLRTQEPRLPPAASPNIIWVQCPAEAQALGAVCGELPVPFDRDHPRRQMINIYFELYFHSNPGPAESAILLNPGGDRGWPRSSRDLTQPALRLRGVRWAAPRLSRRRRREYLGRKQSWIILAPECPFFAGNVALTS